MTSFHVAYLYTNGLLYLHWNYLHAYLTLISGIFIRYIHLVNIENQSEQLVHRSMKWHWIRDLPERA